MKKNCEDDIYNYINECWPKGKRQNQFIQTIIFIYICAFIYYGIKHKVLG